MRIDCDEEGKEALQKLCDIAVRGNGLNVINDVNRILQQLFKEPEQKKKGK